MLQEKNKNLILAADDFGKSEKANRNILALAKSGKLDRVSVMVDGNFAPGEIEALAKTGVAFDIHFELDWQKKRREILRDNTFKQGIIFLKNYFCSGQRKTIEKKWRSQIEKFREIIGRFPDGANSHEYVHLFPSYFKIVLKLSDEFGISRVRFGKCGFMGRKTLAYLILNFLRFMDDRVFRKSGLDSSDYFVSLDWISDFDKFLKNTSEGKMEIACHPERKDEFEIIDKYF